MLQLHVANKFIFQITFAKFHLLRIVVVAQLIVVFVHFDVVMLLLLLLLLLCGTLFSCDYIGMCVWFSVVEF